MPRHSLYLPFAALVMCLPAGAQTSQAAAQDELKSNREFFTVYGNYVAQVETRGITGFKAIALPTFTLKVGLPSLTGERAFAELKQYTDFTDKTQDKETLAVKVRHLVVKGDQAVAHTVETLTSHISNPKSSTSGEASGIYYWKQTWKRTPRGWRLAGMDRDEVKLSLAPSIMTFTVRYTPPKSTPQNTPPVTSATPDK